MVRQMRRQMRRDADRSHAGTAAAMRNAERLVQVQMADIGADRARGWSARPARSGWRRPCRPGRRAHARSRRSRGSPPRTRRACWDRSPSAPPDWSACLSALARRSARSMLPSRSQPTTTTCNPAIAALAGLVPCALDGIRQIVAMPLAARFVIGADRQQAGILALRAGIRLQRDGGEAGDRLQPIGQPARSVRRSPAV